MIIYYYRTTHYVWARNY